MWRIILRQSRTVFTNQISTAKINHFLLLSSIVKFFLLDESFVGAEEGGIFKVKESFATEKMFLVIVEDLLPG